MFFWIDVDRCPHWCLQSKPEGQLESSGSRCASRHWAVPTRMPTEKSVVNVITLSRRRRKLPKEAGRKENAVVGNALGADSICRSHAVIVGTRRQSAGTPGCVGASSGITWIIYIGEIISSLVSLFSSSPPSSLSPSIPTIPPSSSDRPHSSSLSTASDQSASFFAFIWTFNPKSTF